MIKKEGVLVGKTDLGYMWDESGFGAATKMGGLALGKGLEVSLAPKTFRTWIFTSSSLVRAAAK